MKLENRTTRVYDDACGAAHALDFLGERWAMLVVRELLFGARRFGDLRRSLPGISANVLTQRLAGLESVRVVERIRLPPPASVQVYRLTPWGYEAEPIFRALGRWATRSPFHDPAKPLSAVSLLMSFRTMLDRERLGDRSFRVGFRLGAEGFVATVSPRDVEIVRSDPGGADLIVTGTPPQIAAVIYGGAPVTTIGVEGDQSVLALFLTLFPLPATAA